MSGFFYNNNNNDNNQMNECFLFFFFNQLLDLSDDPFEFQVNPYGVTIPRLKNTDLQDKILL